MGSWFPWAAKIPTHRETNTRSLMFIKIKIPHYVTDKCNRSKHYVPVYNTKKIHGASYCRKTHGGVKVISFKRKQKMATNS